MNNQEAIKILEVAKAECEWSAPLEYQGAFDTAIEALKNSVPYEVYERAVIERDMQWNSELGEEIRKDLQPTCNQLATDCISRQAAIDAAHKNYDTILDFKSNGYTIASSFEDIINDLPSAQPEQQWIPCSERLPEIDEEVLVCYDFKGCRSVYIANFYGDGEFHGYDDEYLTPEGRKHRKAVAWMPLPEPYKDAQ